MDQTGCPHIVGTKVYSHIRKNKIAFTRFRVSSHDLLIEKGRHFNINRADRLCIYCHMNVFENEYHFLLVCPFYNNLRKLYFKPYFCHWPNKQKLITLMTSTNKITLLNVSKYIYYAFLIRSSNTL